MLEAFCCAESRSLPQLIVAVSSFMRHNPDIPVRVYCKPGTSVEPLKRLGVRVERVVLANVLMSALDHLTGDTSVSRAVHIGANTLTQDRLGDLAQVDMKGLSIAASSHWAFAPAPDYHGWYLIEDVEGELQRENLNPRYFTYDFIMFNLEYLRTRPRFGYLIDFLRSGMTSERDFLNRRLRDDSYLNMPGNMNVATESVIYPYLPSRELLAHHRRMSEARVARFPGEIVPWRRFERFNRVSMQLPMREYACAARQVEHLIPPDFMATVEANRKKSEHYLGQMPAFFFELKALAAE